ncbi:MAG: hypothetical protein NC048_07265 [Bacteroides sp.]|nr:hypothetical protein [Ruminococcus flavefaciens]MCM1555279.1 hypothetical protein [Bacteroides sp.]
MKIFIGRNLFLSALYGVLGLMSAKSPAQTVPAGNPQDSVPYSFVLVEDFAGTWCNYCPRLTDSLAVLEKEFDNLSIIAHQIGETREEVSFFYNTDAYARSGFYDTVRNLPTIFVNGSEGNTYNPRAAIRKALEKKTIYRMDLSVDHFPDRARSRDSFEIKVSLRCPKPDASRRLILYLAFTQDHFAYKWYNQTELNHALTFMYPNGEGTPVVLDEKGEAEFSFAFGLDYAKSRFPVKNGSITAFVQDATVLRYDTLRDGRIRAVKDKTVLQAQKAYLGDGQYTHLREGEDLTGADFHNRNAETATWQAVRYYDNTMGDVTALHWEFEGGAPAQSDAANPVVYYAAPGRYATTLKVTQNGKTSEIRKENVVSVLDVRPRFSIEPALARPRQNIRVRLLSLSDSCTWHFAGSTDFLVTGKEAAIVYPYEGNYNVQVSVQYRSPETGKRYSFDSTSINAVTIDPNAPVYSANDPEGLRETIRVRRMAGSHRFEISGAEGLLEYADIFSVSGRRVLRTQKAVFDLSPYPDGIYILSVKTKGSQPISFKISK